MTSSRPARALRTATVALVTLGCARNEVDSEELAGRLEAGGFRLVEDPADAETVVVNTCGFVEAAKKDSVDTLLAAADLKSAGPAAGRGRGGLPGRAVRQAARGVAAGGRRRARASTTTPTSPPGCARSWPASRSTRTRRRTGEAAADRPGRADAVRWHASRARPARRRAPASGPPASPARRRPDGAAEAGLAAATAAARSARSRPSGARSCRGVPPTCSPRRAGWPGRASRELFLVSENSTSYGKDLGDLRLLETLLPELAGFDGVDRVRVSYLQPAETRPGLVAAIGCTPGVAAVLRPVLPARPSPVLRRMRRFGDPERVPRAARPGRGRSRPRPASARNVIVGFPGETEDDLETLCDFLVARPARRDRRVRLLRRGRHRGGGLRGKLDADEIRARVAHVTALVEELTAQRAEERIGEEVVVLVESVEREAASSWSRVAPTTRARRSTARRPHRRRRRRRRGRPGHRTRGRRRRRRPGRPGRSAGPRG